jgi:hypothetical protein
LLTVTAGTSQPIPYLTEDHKIHGIDIDARPIKRRLHRDGTQLDSAEPRKLTQQSTLRRPRPRKDDYIVLAHG